MWGGGRTLDRPGPPCCPPCLSICVCFVGTHGALGWGAPRLACRHAPRAAGGSTAGTGVVSVGRWLCSWRRPLSCRTRGERGQACPRVLPGRPLPREAFTRPRTDSVDSRQPCEFTVLSSFHKLLWVTKWLTDSPGGPATALGVSQPPAPHPHPATSPFHPPAPCALVSGQRGPAALPLLLSLPPG